MVQWQNCKAKAKEAILLFRMGDFYEAFYEDAIDLSEALSLTLTKRQGIPMAGIPVPSLENSLEKLMQKKLCVAIAEQMEDPKKAKGLVKRDVVRILTPGTAAPQDELDSENRYLSSLTQVGDVYGLASCDLSTSEFTLVEYENLDALRDELLRLRPRELLINERFIPLNKAWIESLQSEIAAREKKHDEWKFDHEMALQTLLNHYRVASLDGFGLGGMVAGINAGGALIHYLSEELCHDISSITSIKTQSKNFLHIDYNTARHLEITQAANFQASKTLYDHVNLSKTAMGARLLKRWVMQPLVQVNEIKERQNAILNLIEEPQHLLTLEENLKPIRDLERLSTKLASLQVSARDLISLKSSCEKLPQIEKVLSQLKAPYWKELHKKLSPMDSFIETLDQALVEEPPIKLGEGLTFKQGYHEPLDELIGFEKESKQWLVNYQNKLKDELDIKTLRVGFTPAFGYYIDVSKAQSSKMPGSFHKRQTLVNNERFISEELKSFEDKILNAKDRISGIEHSLFDELKAKLAPLAKALYENAQALAHIDALLALALLANEPGYSCPVVDEGRHLEIIKGRHPTIEADMGSDFIPNDTHFDRTTQLLLITGPNMAGKSTYIRQVALLVILAQIGSFVPAEHMRFGVVDKIFTRIGASDDLSRGQSTFMVEMTETANILNNATDQSLVILDEVGRGTSTYDGISIATAIAEELLTSKKPKTLFATHYFELTELEKRFAGAQNLHVSVVEEGDHIVFQHKIKKGAADRSYGIHVAKLAGMPRSVVSRAEKILHELESQAKLEKKKQKPSKGAKKSKSDEEGQLNFFETSRIPVNHKAVDALKKLDINRLTPLDALSKLSELKLLADGYSNKPL